MRRGSRGNTGLLLQTFGGLHHGGLAGTGTPGHGGKAPISRDMGDRRALFVRLTVVVLEDRTKGLVRNTMGRLADQPLGAAHHLAFQPDQLTRRVLGRLALTGTERDPLVLQLQNIQVRQDARHQLLEDANIIHIAMQHLGDIACREDAHFAGDEIQHYL
jgi:hypothetical protein